MDTQTTTPPTTSPAPTPAPASLNRSQAVLLTIAVIIIALGGWYVFKHSSSGGKDPLTEVKNLITQDKDCKTALVELSTILKSYPRLAEAWHFQGVCQFQSGDLTAAKISFERAVSLDSKLEASKNYLKLIASGATPLAQTISFGAQTDFEKKIGFVPDSKVLSFKNVSTQSIPMGKTGSMELGMAVYTSSKSESDVKAYINKTLTSMKGVTFKVTNGEKSTLFDIILVAGKKTSTISISKIAPVQVSITYSSKE